MTEQIIASFEEYIRENGQYYPEWYVGIATDPDDRMFSGHGVDSGSGIWIYWDIPQHTSIVRMIEKYFIKKGARGGSGGGDDDTQYIYAYKITPQTRE